MADTRWALDEQDFRDPAHVISLPVASHLSAALEAEVRGPFWDIVADLGLTLLVTREYEHLVVALSCADGTPVVTALRLPHPSGLVVDRNRGVVHVACTRNPNQLMSFGASSGWLPRADRATPVDAAGLVPVTTRFFPGCLYLHDLALVGGRLMGNAVGMNAVVDFSGEAAALAWWPWSMEGPDGPVVTRNLIQLNSIAAGDTLETSFFSASTERFDGSLPGSLEWTIERQGVVFSGATREPVVRGLTRPHSARLDAGGRLWVDDSGFGTLNVADGDRATPVTSLPGWTRGLCLIEPFAFVGSSRVIPRFAAYAPGLDVDASTCGVHIVDTRTGGVAASLTWPDGNQVFAIDWLSSETATGFLAGRVDADPADVEASWYHFSPPISALDPTTSGA